MADAPRTYGRRRRRLPAQGDSAPAAPEREVITGRVVSTSTAPTSMGGWDAMDQVASASGSDLYLKVTEEPTIIKVLTDGPFDVFNSHWIDEIEDGSKSVRCWGTPECPLCQVGDKAKRFSACFDVVSLEDPKHPTLKVWEAGVKVARQLKEIAMDTKKGPLNRADLYFSIRRLQKAKAVEYILERVKERDLEEEHDVAPLDEAALAEFTERCHTWGDQVKEPYDQEAMEEVVDLIMQD